MAAPPSPPRVIIVMGVSGSGKTVVGRLLAAALGLAFHDADDHHPPENVERMRRGIPLDDGHRGPWLDRLAGLVDDALAGGQGIVLACSALKRRYRERIGAGRPRVRLVHLDAAEEVIRKRLEQRTGHFMPPSLLASQCALLERPAEDEAAITVDVAAEPVAIVRCIVAELGRFRCRRRSRDGSGPESLAEEPLAQPLVLAALELHELGDRTLAGGDSLRAIGTHLLRGSGAGDEQGGEDGEHEGDPGHDEVPTGG